ncbi:hypothetical protein [Streptomyces sp. NBC_00878]|uniref:hypothetical protein n=1 Tax=Streptomyces sp. NBC_00878 TaxID=2975854 RepID=UPI00225BF50F|nr:hypothetical protein [Streptomyces sp. NBC_00878]MCX4911825.1 hypothetical protein [Streptomyces sp. NBC_00878]
MNKATATEAGIVITSGVVASRLASELADQDVSVVAIVAVVMAVLSSGIFLAIRIGQGLRTTYYTCPTKGCPVSVRASNASTAEMDRYRTYVTDHTQHTGGDR